MPSLKNFVACCGLLLLTLLILGLSACSSLVSTTPDGHPDTMRITIDVVTPHTTTPVSLMTDRTLVQQLYTTIYSLSQLDANQPCTMELGPHYTLTFYEGPTAIRTVIAKREGCQPVTIGGETQTRQASPTFWSQLDQAVKQSRQV